MLLVCVTSMLFIVTVLGKPFFPASSQVHGSIPDAEAPAAQSNRYEAPSLAAIRQMLLDELKLQRPPQGNEEQMVKLRKQWKDMFSTTDDQTVSNTSPVPVSGSDDLTNITSQSCCQLASRIFMKDLDFDRWILYPESFTYTQCTACTSQLVKGVPQSCCKPTSYQLLHVLYMNELHWLVISSVRLPQQCGCGLVGE